jgi:hypothetical protein
MCFSNLPIEFDENGEPYLAEEADEVDRLDCAEGVALEELDPEAAFDDIVASVSDDIVEHLGETTDPPERPRRTGSD